MSLINQMLKDLESRRPPENPGHTLLAGHAGEGAGGMSRKLLILLSVLVALLALILAYLVWERFGSPAMSRADESRALAAAVAPAQAAPPMPAPKRITPSPSPAATAGAKPSPAAPRPLVAPPPVPPQPQLLAIEPQQLTGSWEKQRLILRGRNLDQGSQVLVAWDEEQKLLPPNRVHWRDSNTLEVEIITGTAGGEWTVALAGSQARPLRLKVLTPEQAEPDQTSGEAPIARGEEAEPASAIEKHIRPLRPEQQAEKAYQAGYKLLQLGDRDGAERKWREALGHEPRHIASREGLAGLYLSQGRNVEAGELLAKGLEYHPGYGQFALLAARLQMENGQTAAALATLEKALEADTQGADFLAFLAALYQREKLYDKSVAAYQRALPLQPKNAVWWMGIGISLEGAGKPQEALTAYREARKSGNLPPKLMQYVEGRIGALQ